MLHRNDFVSLVWVVVSHLAVLRNPVVTVTFGAMPNPIATLIRLVATCVFAFGVAAIIVHRSSNGMVLNK